VAPAGDVIDTLKASGQFTIFLRSADAVGLTAFVKSLKDVTVLAPTDSAFRSLPAADIQALMALANRAELQKTVLYHFIPARVPTADFAGAARTAVTLAKLPVQMEGGKPPGVNGVAFVQMDIVTSNGVIHVIDKVLSPNAAAALSSFRKPWRRPPSRTDDFPSRKLEAMVGGPYGPPTFLRLAKPRPCRTKSRFPFRALS